MTTRSVCLIVLACVACLLPGCVKLHSHLTVQKNGSADVEHIIAIEQSMMPIITQERGKDPLKELRGDMAQSGYTVVDYTEGSMVGVKAVKHFKDISSAVNALGDPAKNADKNNKATLGSIGDIGKALKVEKSFFSTKYTLNADIDLAASPSSTGAQPSAGDPFASLGEGLAQSVFDMSFALTLPVKPASTNASRVSDNGKTLEWPINVTGKTNLAAEVTVPNITNIGFTIAGGILLLIIVLFIAIGNRKKKVTVG